MNLKYFCEDHSWQVDVDTGDLLQHGKAIEISGGAKGVVKYLVNHPNEECKYDALYEAMKKAETRKSKMSDTIDPDRNRAIKDIFNNNFKDCPYFNVKKPESRDHIVTVWGKGIKFIPTHDIVLSLTIDCDKTNGSGIVVPIVDFCGRDNDVEWLMANAFQGKWTSNLLVLSGPSGIGKTELARAFVDRCMSEDIPADLCFRKVIWTTFDKNLKETIANLPCDSLAKPSFERNLKALVETASKKTLLVIDNVDTPWDCGEMDTLLGTGCQILLTSKLNFKDERRSVRQYAVRPLATDDLVQLFVKKSNGHILADASEEVRDLIENYLHRHTYLTVLTAGLMDLYSIENIKERLRSLTVRDIGDSVVGCKDDSPKNQPLFDHFKTLFDAALPDIFQKIFLLHLALLPVGGLPQSWFLDHAFKKEERTNMTAARNTLSNRYFCFVENRNGESYIKLQPLMREVILRQDWDRSYIGKLGTYLTNLILELDRPHYHSETPRVLQAATAAVTGLRILPPEKLETGNVPLYTQLLCQIVSVYKLLENKAGIMEYADEAAEWLAKIQPKDWTWDQHRDEISLFLTAYNNLAYPLTNIGKTDLATTVFQKAMDVMKPFKDQMLSDDTFAAKASKIYNNFGANFLKAKEYEKALEIHQEVLEHRQAIVDKDPDNAEHKALLAASYKAIGTDLYWLGSYAKSLENHEKAVALYRDYLGEDSLECVTALNRMIGAGICSGKTETYGQWLRQLERGLRDLKKIEFVEQEIVNAVKHAATIVFNEQSLKKEGIEILNLANTFPKTEKLTEAIKSLESVL